MTNINPYQYMGIDVSGKTDLDEILTAGGADFDVKMTPVQVQTDTGVIEVDSHRAAVRTDTDEVLAVHSKGYRAIQYREVAELALDAVGLRASDATLRYLGTINNGKQFYATIDLGSLVLDPEGIADEISKYLVAFGSHDGTLPVMFAESNFRVVCSNQAPAIRKDHKPYCVKHTKNSHDRLAVAGQALGVADKAAAAFIASAEKMLRIPVTKTTVRRLGEQMWPLTGDSDRAQTIHTSRLNTLERLFDGPTNAPAVGENGWALFNTVTEYLDHGRGTNADKRAAGTIVPGTWVEARKVEAAERILALA